MKRLAEIINEKWNPETKFWKIIKHNVLGLLITWVHPLILSLIISFTFFTIAIFFDGEPLGVKLQCIGSGFLIYPTSVALIFIGYTLIFKPIRWLVLKLFR
jgi:hypothetical protein